MTETKLVPEREKTFNFGTDASDSGVKSFGTTYMTAYVTSQPKKLSFHGPENLAVKFEKMPPSYPEEEDKPCRACSDFKTWAKQQGKSTLAPPNKKPPKDCPLDKEELGSSTWGFLHSVAAYYPEKPTKAQRCDMAKFFNIFAQFYPCEPCAKDFMDDIQKNPPKTHSRQALSKWLCERHNIVNLKLGKPAFDCSKVLERWRDGWKDGSCD